MRHLGALGFLCFWMLAASGAYLYLRFDTSAAGAYESIGALEWWFGGLLRSLHRYAADAFVVLALAHLGRELWLGRFRGFRAFSWISGVPLLWLVYASGVVGYWLVWDTRSQFSYSATLEWFGLGALALEAPDRLFSLFVFLHIGIPLALLAGMWVHMQRMGQPKTHAPRALAWGFSALLLAAALVHPALSGPRWDAAHAPQDVAVDWWYQFIHPLMYGTSPAFVWALAGGASALLLALPYLGKKPALLPAQVDPANCNGCGRCVADCPYQAIILSATGKASVFDQRCAACGICAGACPSSTPFRSIRELVSGIELPDSSIRQLRQALKAALPAAEVVFSCEKRPAAGGIRLRCLAMLPPAFVEYALRNGAQRVRALGCEECAYRLGMELSDARFAGVREPHLRKSVVFERKDDEYRFRLRST